MFIDQVEIEVKSGKGGDGMVHFRREKYIPRGGPDGGDGGRGGDVILEVISTINTLSAFRQNRNFKAKDGTNGGSQKRHGKAGESLVLPVPPGTMVFDMAEDNLIGDLTSSGQRLIVCKGGRGGRGNTHFKNSINQVPRTAEKGEPGEEKRLRLDLRLIADIGIIGFPNAGKSTLLSALTNAKPRIAPYPFTTLEPNLGVAIVDEKTAVIIADIPGLIEGASQGAGLGYAFLRHISRTKILIHLLDGMAVDPLDDYNQINSELALFDPNLRKKPQIIAINKADQPEVQARWSDLRKQLRKQKVHPFLVSALNQIGLKELLREVISNLSEASLMHQDIQVVPIYRPSQEDIHEFTISRVPGGWRIQNKFIEKKAKMTQWDQSGSVRRFQKMMERLGVDEALRKEGAQTADTVFIGDYELEYQE